MESIDGGHDPQVEGFPSMKTDKTSDDSGFTDLV